MSRTDSVMRGMSRLQTATSLLAPDHARSPPTPPTSSIASIRSHFLADGRSPLPEPLLAVSRCRFARVVVHVDMQSRLNPFLTESQLPQKTFRSLSLRFLLTGRRRG